MMRRLKVGAASGKASSHGFRKPPAIDAEMGHSSIVLFQSPMAMISASARACNRCIARRVSVRRARASVAE
eukprot:259486-Alexandrium_andersonii.AAC.1